MFYFTNGCARIESVFNEPANPHPAPVDLDTGFDNLAGYLQFNDFESCQSYLSEISEILKTNGSALTNLIHSDGDNLLFRCIKNGTSPEVIQLLIEEYGFWTDLCVENKRPILLAFENGRKDVFDYLKNTCSLNFIIDGNSFLHCLIENIADSAEYRREKIAMFESILLRHPQINTQNQFGQAPSFFLWEQRDRVPDWRQLMLSLVAAGAELNSQHVPRGSRTPKPFYFSFFKLEKTQQNAEFLTTILEKAELHLKADNKTGNQKKQEWFQEFEQTGKEPSRKKQRAVRA